MPEFSEQWLIVVLAGGVALVALGYLVLVVRAFGTGTVWGVVSLVLAPVGGLLYGLVYRARAAVPIILIVLGLITAAVPIGYTQLAPPPPKVVKTEQVGGEARGTLTGASESDAATYLAANRDAAVLQMANRQDITDTLLAEHVRGMPNLRELDLNDTPVTDAGLEVLATLPKLEQLRIARTKATADGVAKHVLSLKGLKSIDVGGLNVPGKALRDWKNADPMNRKYVN